MIPSSSASLLTLTDSAMAKVQHLIETAGNPALKLRVYIIGGGCSGFQYGFKLDDQLNPDDTVLNMSTFDLAIASLAIPYLQGSVIDYVENLQGARFAVENPNAETTCGCGSSFALKTCAEKKCS
jgi:iron-sulfur cluster insertion protein